LRNIRCIRALSRYAVTRPVEPQIIDRLVGFDHDNYRSLTHAGLLQVHVFTVNVLPHINLKSGAISSCICRYTRRNGTRLLPQVYRKDTSVCPNNLISISMTISISATWFVGAFDCRRVGLSVSWFVGELDCRRVGLSASWIVGELSSYPVSRLPGLSIRPISIVW